MLGIVDFAALVTPFDREGLLQMALAVILGGLIGLEREFRGRPAGLRTMIVVCLGSTLVMVVSSSMSAPSVGGFDPAITRVDPGRIAAGVVTGIGFLGAGVVIKLGDLVRGVTTAATIWFVAVLGVALGQGFYLLSVVATLVALVVLWLFGVLEKLLRSSVYRTVQLRVAAAESGSALARARTLFDEFGMRVMELRVTQNNASEHTDYEFYVKTNEPDRSAETVQRLAEGVGVLRVRWS